MRDAVILSAVRLPTGKFLGTLKGFTAPQLGAMVVREAVRAPASRRRAVDEVIMGNVVSAGLGQAPARQAAIGAGLPPEVAALTINKVCGSGLKAVMLAAQGDRHRRRRRRRRRRHGVHVERPYLLAARARGPAPRPRRARRLDDPRRPVGRLQGLPHGLHGRDRGREVRRHARRSRTSTRSRATAARSPPSRPASSRTRSCPCPSRRRRATPSLFDDRRDPARGHVARGAGAS